MRILEVQELSYSLPDGTTLLQDISFSLEEGEILIISGRNGSGKSILLRLLNGLIRPSSGRVRIDAADVTTEPVKARESLGLVFQNSDAQIIGQTVYKDIAFSLRNLRLDRPRLEERVRKALTQADLIEHARQRPRTLSGGEKRRLAIAAVAVSTPKVIALDEPFANLDYPAVRSVLRLLLDLRSQGHSLIIVTHELEKVLAHADKLLLLDSGRVYDWGDPLQVLPKATSCGVRVPSRIDSETIEAMTWLND